VRDRLAGILKAIKTGSIYVFDVDEGSTRNLEIPESQCDLSKLPDSTLQARETYKITRGEEGIYIFHEM